MGLGVPLSAEEKKWQAEADAHTLAEAERIKQDKSRLDNAQGAAKRMAEEEAEKAKAMRKVAGRSSRASSGSGRTSRRGQRSGGTSPHNVFKRI